MLDQVAGFTLSPQQTWQWLSPQRRRGALACAIILEGDLDLESLARALQKLNERNEILRTTFVRTEESQFPLQVINDGVVSAEDVSDLRGLSTDEQQQRIDEALLQETLRQWNPEQGPSWRRLLFVLSARVHVLVLSASAMCADAATLRNLFLQLSQLYHSAKNAEDLDIEELQYVECAEWQNQLLEDESETAGRDFWRKQGFNAPPIKLPFAVQTTPGANAGREIFSFSIDPATIDLVQPLLSQSAASLPDFLLAVWKILLWRVTGQSSLNVAQMFDGRRSELLQNVLGPFARWIPITNSFVNGMRFGEVLKEIQQSTAAAADWQEYFAGEPDTDLSQAFSFDRQPEKQMAGALTLLFSKLRSSADQFELNCHCIETGEALHVELYYDSNVYGRDYLVWLAEQFQTMLADAAAHPETRIDDLKLLSLHEQARLLVEFNRTSTKEFDEKCFHTRFEAQVERAPNHIAVIFEDEQLTYTELNARANRLAHCLRALGAAPEVVVGIYLKRSADMLVAVLGIAKAGAAYLPLDRSYPRERLAFMLKDAGVKIVITQQQFASELPDHDAEVICLDVDERLSIQCAENPVVRVMPDNLIYVLYTSGSTGRPKGVMIPHRGLTNYLDWCLTAYVRGNGRGSLVHSPLGFDLTITSLLTPLLAGETATVLSEENGVLALANALRRGDDFSLLKLTPAHLEVLNQELYGEELSRKAQTLVVGGEALRGKILYPWLAPSGGPRVINEYGPTETVVGCCTDEVRYGTSEGPVPIGKPISNTQIYILDQCLRPLPVGITGELYVGGFGLARGYLGSADLTAERFIPNPFSDVPGARLYRTGDLARFQPDGKIEFLGRNDEQVKIDGYRVELGEVEAVLGEHESVREAVVVVSKDEFGGKGLAAYVTVDPEAAVTSGRLKEYLTARLPAYAVPSAFVMLDRFPLTANGKIDRGALPAPGREVRALRNAYVEPRTSIEKTLAEIWMIVLNVDKVGINDSFFALGGDSIRSVRVVALAKERGINFTIQEIFKYQTLERLAQEARTGAPEDEFIRTQPFSLISEADFLKLPTGVEDAYPLTMLQTGMLYHMKGTPESATYHNVSAWRLRFPFQQETFQAAVNAVVAVQDNLRTSFDLTTYSEPLQLVHKNVSLPVHVYDWRHLAAGEQHKAIAQFLKQQNEEFFDITQAPLVRIFIHRLEDESCLFTFIEPHSISDGWSTTSTLGDIFEQYFALFEREAPLRLPPAAIPYRDFVRMEREALNTPEVENYWLEKLEGVTPIQLPRWPEATGPQNGRVVGKQGTFIDDDILAGLMDLAAAEGVPLKTILLAAYMKAISFISGHTDVMAGLVSNGRPEEVDGERMRGLFLNTLPFRLKLDGGSWRDLVRETFDAETRMLPFRWYPMAALQRRWREQPLFEVAFTYLNFHSIKRVLDSGKVEILQSYDLSRTNYTLSVVFILNLGPTPQLELVLEYESTLLCDEQVKNYLGYFDKILRAMVSKPLDRHEAENLLSFSENQELLVQFNDTSVRYDGAQCIHELFEAQVERTPERIAVVAEQETLTFRELNARANQLAHYLRRLGVGPEVLVGLMLERSTAMVVALLGVLKAGGAYVPLDPHYPEERLRYMLRDAGVAVTVTEGQWLEVVADAGGVVVSLEREAAQIALESAVKVQSGVTAENLAYVIYTSGSTGQPKGAMNTHGGVRNRLLWMQQQYQLGAADAVLQKTAFSFDVSVWEFFWPLLAGARLVLARPGGERDSVYLMATMSEQQVTTVHFVPSLLQVLLEEEGLEWCASLRQVFCSGEVLPVELQRRFFARSAAELHNLYGPTEAAIDVSYWRCRREEEERWSVPIGRPIANMQLYILDSAGQPAPVGVSGELYLSGAGVGRGYHQRPELTAERFVPDAFSGVAGGRSYRTGDLARYLRGGEIEYLGRLDEQVKIRGFRIELGEVAAALSRHEAVAEAVVVARETHKQLVAYVVARAGAAVSRRELRQYLKQQLPDYMVPAAFVVLEAMPLTPNGKLDRKALPALELVQPGTEQPFVGPETETEQTIAQVWREVLHQKQIDIHSNFFDIGGDSLLLLRTNAKLRQALDRDLSIVEMFRYPTINSLAGYLNQQPTQDAVISESRSRAQIRQALSQQRQQARAI